MSNVIAVVVPTIRPERMQEFRAAWAPLFERHQVYEIVVWDGDDPNIEVFRHVPDWDQMGGRYHRAAASRQVEDGYADLFCRHTDAVRNYGFVVAATLGADYVYTLDDDCLPPSGADPIQEHLDVLAKRVPLNWLNTAHAGAPYLRGAPYGIRDEAPVMVSHGVWTGTPDFDGETQLALEATKQLAPVRVCSRCSHEAHEDSLDEVPGRHVPCPVLCCAGVMQVRFTGGVPSTLPYYVGPVPAGTGFQICGMNLMVRKEALPFLYFSPMGPDSGYPDLHRFADIWMGYRLIGWCRKHRWGVYTGGATVVHTRASDARKNFEAEKLGRDWNEHIADTFFGVDNSRPPAVPKGADDYIASWMNKAGRFAHLIRSLQGS